MFIFYFVARRIKPARKQTKVINTFKHVYTVLKIGNVNEVYSDESFVIAWHRNADS